MAGWLSQRTHFCIFCLSKDVKEESSTYSCPAEKKPDICFLPSTICHLHTAFWIQFSLFTAPGSSLGDCKTGNLFWVWNHTKDKLQIELTINILTVNESRLLRILTFGHKKCHLCILAHDCFMELCYLQLSNVMITMATPHSVFLLFCFLIC